MDSEKKFILLVEDNPDQLLFLARNLQRKLERKGIADRVTILKATNLEHACDKLAASRSIDVVVADRSIPKYATTTDDAVSMETSVGAIDIAYFLKGIKPEGIYVDPSESNKNTYLIMCAGIANYERPERGVNAFIPKGANDMLTRFDTIVDYLADDITREQMDEKLNAEFRGKGK